MASKWSMYRDEVMDLINSNPTMSPSVIAQTVADNNDIEYQDTFRMWVSRMRKREGYAPFKKGERSVAHETKGATSYEENPSKGEANWEYKGEQVITTLEDALKFSNVNLEKWEVDRHLFNSWDVTMKDKQGHSFKRTNYQVKVWFKKKVVENEEELKEFLELVNKTLKNRKSIPKIKKSKKKKKVGFVPIADLHIGAYIRELILTQDYDVDKVISYLDEAAEEINSQNYSEVHIAIMGDIIESFTGKNHENSFQSVGYNQTGFSVMITAYEILENFLSKIENLKKVYAVSGNHDRYSASNKEDTKGEVLQGVSYFLNKFLKVDVEYDPIVINAVIDGISYIITHGHHRFIAKNIEKVILDYGVQGMYNVVVKAHDHTRKKSDTIVRVGTIIQDSANYRGYTCPPFFTGNLYSESNGWTSTAGFLQMWNKKGKICCLDIPLI